MLVIPKRVLALTNKKMKKDKRWREIIFSDQ
jgi:hypothetical protein